MLCSADAQAIEKNLLQFVSRTVIVISVQVSRFAQFQPNVIGIAQTIQAFLPLVRKGQQKKILVVTSSMGSPAFALDALSDNCIAYSTSKAALNMIVAKYALACKDDGVIFLSVSPGLVKTMPGGEWLNCGATIAEELIKLTNADRSSCS